MILVSFKRPSAGDHSAYYNTYIRLVPDGDIVALLDGQIAETEALLATYTEAQAQWRPAPGEWNATEIVGHVADAERVFAYRALCFARGDTTPLPGMDPDVFMREAGFTGRTLADVAAEFVAVRRATLPLLARLDTAAWERGGTADGNPITVRALAYIIAGHERHHMADLRRYPALADAANGAS